MQELHKSSKRKKRNNINNMANYEDAGEVKGNVSPNAPHNASAVGEKVLVVNTVVLVKLQEMRVTIKTLMKLGVLMRGKRLKIL